MTPRPGGRLAGRLVRAGRTVARDVALGLALGLVVLAALAALAALPAARAADGAWSWPLRGPVTVVRGFQPPPAPWLAGHRGVDLATSPGAPVLAAGAGRVSFAGSVAGVPVVTVTHADGRRTTYQPVLAAVAVGDQVARGAVLGGVSAAGSHCFPLACLHWGLLRDKTYLDPLTLVGGDLRVRLLPVRTASPGPQLPAMAWAAAPVAEPGLVGDQDPARLGAVNRARVAPWERW
jgi:murein DD-endopeptidase MepM/ murein hydrolase activator NlpD